MISKEEIQNLAELSRLKLSDEEIAALQKDFDSILEYVAQVSQVSEGSLQLPESPLRNVMREDKPREIDDIMANKRAPILGQAPKREGDYFSVRKIIEREE